ncbi:hypothetical protein B9Z19DRAFT_1088275 [Tuber borchii]|uniref:Uncharacterized protein n=1 Tax=Tuber borchii TaxID=42251 RepID=A0A2T6ZLR1_TUBBO|nr:hypothetical protein B9Z19DRAFT_1088275 [Tuber borchii]
MYGIIFTLIVNSSLIFMCQNSLFWCEICDVSILFSPISFPFLCMYFAHHIPQLVLF